jgi:hypothetical protein
MNIKEAQVAKAALELEIAVLIGAFEKATGFAVTDVRLEKLYRMGCVGESVITVEAHL